MSAPTRISHHWPYVREMADRMSAEKRLTAAELAAEWHRSAAVTGIHGPHVEGNRTAIIRRFATLPHYDEEQS